MLEFITYIAKEYTTVCIILVCLILFLIFSLRKKEVDTQSVANKYLLQICSTLLVLGVLTSIWIIPLNPNPGIWPVVGICLIAGGVFGVISSVIQKTKK